MNVPSESISADFPYESRYIEVHGQKMHYIEKGEGDPILFLHGNPTSSYLWRNIIPYLEPHGRCIAPDLIGMGKSAKPGGKYRFMDHYPFIEGFIKNMDLQNITLVIHDWGSGLGFHYASQHETNIKAIAFMEAIVRPLKWDMFPKDFKMGFKIMRTPVIGWFMVSVMNAFVEKILPSATLRKLTEEEMDHYREPFRKISSRQPVRQWPLEIPIDGNPSDMHELITNYSAVVGRSSFPKLLLYAKPGGVITKETVEWVQEHYRNLSTVSIGKGLHFVQEDNPHGIGKAISDWYTRLKK